MCAAFVVDIIEKEEKRRDMMADLVIASYIVLHFPTDPRLKLTRTQLRFTLIYC